MLMSLNYVLAGMFPVSRALLQWSKCRVAALCWNVVWHGRCSSVSIVWLAWHESNLPAAESTTFLSRHTWRAFRCVPSTWLFLYLHTRYTTMHGSRVGRSVSKWRLLCPPYSALDWECITKQMCFELALRRMQAISFAVWTEVSLYKLTHWFLLCIATHNTTYAVFWKTWSDLLQYHVKMAKNIVRIFSLPVSPIIVIFSYFIAPAVSPHGQ